jgi:competence ComEA-like helix-hairpin-helix protein
MLIVAPDQTSAQTSPDVLLPDGKGKDAVESACGVCHNYERITRQKLTADQWRNTVREMVENGAALNPEEWDPVVAYLARNFGPAPQVPTGKVNVNKGSAKDIATGLQVTTAEAEAIVAYRLANGAFHNLKDFEKVPGVDMRKIGAAKELIEF